MDKFIVRGGNALKGKVEVHGAKNAFLPILAGSILASGKITLLDAPNIVDIDNMLEILKDIGVKVEKQERSIILDTTNCGKFNISSELTNKLRASIFLLGPMLARHKVVKIAYPGGCAIGLRPIDISLNGLRALNVKIVEEHGYIFCDGSNMKSGNYILRFASVGATENLIMASVFLSGETRLKNVAKEPEIVDLCNFLNKMGAKIYGAGTNEIIIKGVRKLNAVEYKPIGDRIVAGTFLLSTLVTTGKVEICNINPQYLTSLIKMLKNNNCEIKTYDDKIIVSSNKRLNSIPYIQTMPYPFFPTDLQSQILVLQAVSIGCSTIRETVFENRFKIVGELNKMGANIVVDKDSAFLCGVEKLSGASVSSTDLRAAASLIMAGLNAEGYTTIDNIHYLERGYENFDEDLKRLGADIKRL